MKTYRVVIHGTDFKLISERKTGGHGDTKPVVGFYTTRYVLAQSEDRAFEKAKKLVIQEWVRTGLYENAGGKYPMLVVDGMKPARIRIPFLQSSGKGFTFYPAE